MPVTGYSAPSEEEMQNGAAGNGDPFPRLDEDEYIATITSIVVEQKPNNFPSKGDEAPVHDMIKVKYDLTSFADGEPLVAYLDWKDERGTETVEPEKVVGQVFLNPKKVGMVPVPAKTRKFFAAALGQALSDPISITNFDDLVGKTLIVSIKNEGGYNNAKDFRAAKRARGRTTTPKGPTSASAAVARASEVFDEDSPTNTAPNPALNSDDDLDF